MPSGVRSQTALPWRCSSRGAYRTRGCVIYDVVVSDGQGAINNGRLGPCRVEYVRLAQDQLIQWPTRFPGTLAAAVQAVYESPGFPSPFTVAPDGDSS